MAVAIAGLGCAHGQFVAYHFATGANNDPNPTSVSPGLTAGPIRLSDASVFSSFSTTVGDPPGSATAGPWNGSKYMSFTLTADPGQQLSLSGISFSASRQSDANPGPSSVGLYLNGGFVGSAPPGNYPTMTHFDVPLSGSFASVTFGFLPTAAGGLFGLDRIQVWGTVVPEPASGITFLAFALAGFGLWHRRPRQDHAGGRSNDHAWRSSKEGRSRPPIGSHPGGGFIHH